jgi:signal transduction histidine kinase/CheY-like chemotaxis protein
MTDSWIDRLKLSVPMLSEYKKHIRPASDISPEKHAQLLKMTHERLVYSFKGMPVLAVFGTLFYAQQHDGLPLGLWSLGYCIAYILSRNRNREFEADMRSLDAQALIARWEPKIKGAVTIHGLALCAPFVLTSGSPSFEFNALWYLVIARIVASNAAYLTPVLSIFVRFFNCSWNVASLLSVIAFPDHWYFITPIILMFTGANYRQALMAHKFFLQQVRLDESSTRLAAHFKLAKESAETLLIEKSQFLATASHDLRQPVHAMGMLIEAIKHQNKDPALQPALRDLGSSLHSMNAMFNSLLDLSKLESGVSKINLQSIDLRHEVATASTIFVNEAAHRQLALRVFLPKRAAIVECDANLLRQVISNLMQNALRYTLTGGILIGLRSRGAHWQLEVCDTGIGVAEENKSNIYLPYFRQEQAWNIHSAGHGLGLSVVARCAKLMDTPFGMNSKLGRGSRFWIQFQKGQIASASPVIPIDQQSSGTTQLVALNKGPCLIVEDDPQVTKSWHVLMQVWGVETKFATNSVEAFSILQQGFCPNVVMCDERLRAGESGFELLKEILNRQPDAHGVMISGEFYSPALKQAEEEGYLVFRKPVDVALIHAVLRRWL